MISNFDLSVALGLNYLLICTYKENRKIGAIFEGTSGYYSLLKLKWLRYVINILGPEIWEPHLKETHITIDYKIVVSIPNELPQKQQPQIDVFSLQMYCTYKVMKKPFNMKPGYFRVLL